MNTFSSLGSFVFVRKRNPQAPDYIFSVQNNLYNESVWAIYNDTESVWYNQPDLSFSAPNVYLIDVSDPSNNGYVLSFGTDLDVYDATIESSYVTRTGTPGQHNAKIVLTLRNYSGPNLLCFERDISGMAYIEYNLESSWTQKGSDLDGEATADQYGDAVSVSSDGNVVAVGSSFNDGGGSNSGHARVFAWDGSDWIQRGNDIDGEAASDQVSTVSLSSDGTIVAVGAEWNDGGGSNSGHIRVFEWDGSTWTKIGNDIDGASGSFSGGSINLSSDGTVIASGAMRYDITGYADAGYVGVYEYNGSSWIQRGSYITGEQASEYCGFSVWLSSDGNTVACGSQRYNSVNGTDSGRVRVFVWNSSTSTWTQRGSDLIGDGAGSYYGSSVSLSSNGNILAIGGTHNNDGANNGGYTNVFEWDGNSWTQLGNNFYGTANYGYNGWSISLSSDGTILATSTPRSDGLAGRVCVYKWDGSSWNQIGVNIVGESGGDHSGWSVSLSSNGSTLAIGATQNDGDSGVSNDNRGHARVYTYMFSTTYYVTVSGSPEAFYLNDSMTPEVVFETNTSYLFDQSDPTNDGQQIVFGYTPDNTTNILTPADGVTVMGSPGQPGAYTELILPSGFVGPLYYYSDSSANMGYNPIMYKFTVQTNIYDEPVWALYDESNTVWYNQPDLSFSAPNVYVFDVSDPSNNGYVLSFGTTVDVSDATIESSYVTRTNTPGTTDAKVLLNLRHYSGASLVYFEDTSTNMGYYIAGLGYSVPEIPPRPVIMVNAEGNTQVDTTNKKFGTGSCLLDGDVDYLRIDSSYNQYFSLSGDFTVELWAYKNTHSNSNNASGNEQRQLLVSNWGPGNNAFYLSFFSQTQLAVYLNTVFGVSENNLIVNYTASLNTWTHYAVVRNSGTVTIYADGTSLGSYSYSGAINLQEDWAFGANAVPSDPKQFLKGQLDEIRISDTARYTSNFTPATSAFINDTNTLLLLHCDGTGGSTTFLDDAVVLINYNVTVSNEVFYIDGTPQLQIDFSAYKLYVFDQSDPTNAGQQLVFGYAPDNTTNILTTADGVTVMGTPGQPGAYTQLDLSAGFVGPLYYYSDSSANMGYSIPVDITYSFTVQTNVIGDNVWSLYDTSNAVWYNQPDMSFSAPYVYEFVVSDPSNNGYVLSFGTTVDVYDAAIDISYVTRTNTPGTTNAKVLLDLRDYSGQSLVYFEDTSAGMGYVDKPQTIKIDSVLDADLEYFYKFDSGDINASGKVYNHVTKSFLTQQYSGLSGSYSIENGQLEISNPEPTHDYSALRTYYPISSSSTVTVSFWIHVTGFENNYGGIIQFDSNETTGSAEITVHYSNPTVHANNIATMYFTGSGAPNAGIVETNDLVNGLSHFVYTQSNTNGIRMYVNNTQTHSTTSTITNKNYIVTAEGKNPGYGLDCTIDNYRIYSKEMTASEVSYLYDHDFDSNDYYVSVSGGVFYLSDVEKPNLTFVSGEIYVFDQSDESNAGEQLVFGATSDDKVNLYATGVTIMGTPGQPGAYTQYIVPDPAPSQLYYYSFNGNNMGYS